VYYIQSNKNFGHKKALGDANTARWL